MDNNNLNNTNNDNMAENNTYSYNQQGGYQMEEPKKSSGLAIASMVCGILSIVLCCIWYLSVVLAIVAVVLGIVSNVKGMGGRGMAIAGIVTGVVGVVLSIGLIILAAIGIASTELSTYGL